MTVVDWEGQIKLTIGYISRADQLDLFATYQRSEWAELKAPDGKIEEGIYLTRRLMATDAMAAAVATQRIEVCKGGKWVVLKKGQTHTVKEAGFSIGYPATFEMINACPRQLADEWIETAIEKNGNFNANTRLKNIDNNETEQNRKGCR